MRADWLNDPEYAKLLEFLVEKTKEVKTVLRVKELTREFKIKTSSSLKAHCLDSRIYRFRPEISKMPHLDTETKIKLIFGLSGSVDQGFLRELRKEAVVTVDDFNRITHYKKNDGGLELNGIHKTMVKADWLNDPEYAKLLEFLVEKTKEVKTVLRVKKLAKEFKKHSYSEQNVICLESRIRGFRSKIHKMSHLDTDTKVKLIFGLSGTVDRGFLRELRKDAEVTVDEFNRIIHYKKNEGGLELQGVHGPGKAEMSNDQILEFLAKKVEEKSGIISIHRLAKQLREDIGSSQSDRHLQRRIREAMKQIYECEIFDEEMKVRMIFATKSKVEEYALKELQENADIVVDDDNRIIEYQKNDGSLNLKREAFRRVSFNQKQKRKSDIKSDGEGDSEDVEEEKETMEVTTRSGRISKKRFSDASLFNNQDDNGPSSPRNDKLKSSYTPTTSNKKRKTSEHTNATVMVYGKNQIKKYKKKDGSLYLNRKDSQIKCGNGNNTVDESDDMEDPDRDVKDDEESDDEGDSEEDVEDDSEEEEETMEVTTRSGRRSKRRFSAASLFNDKDDIGHSSRRNEKLKNTISNTPTTSNKKRKILNHGPESVGKKEKKTVEVITPEEEETRERAPVDDYDNDYSIDISYHYNDNTDVTLEPFDGPLNDDTSRGNNTINGDDSIEEIPAPTENFVAPKQKELVMDVKMDSIDMEINSEGDEDVEGIDKPIQQDSIAPNEGLVIPKNKEILMDVKEKEPDIIIFNDQIDEKVDEKHTEDIMKVLDDSMEINSSNSHVKNGPIQHFPTSSEDVKEDETSLILILESFHDFIDILDLPILSDLQKKIEAKLEECKRNSKVISNQLIYFSLELCLLKVNENREMKESVESFRLETFIRHLRHAVVTLKLPSLMEFREKLKKIIGELRVQNKFIPVTAIRIALQNVIDNVIDF